MRVCVEGSKKSEMPDSFSQSNADQSTMELIIDQVEELIVTIIEEIRQRPSVALAIVAAIAGAVAGSMLASRVSRRRVAPKAREIRKRGMREAADLAATGVKRIQNPLVRSFLRAALEGQLKKRFSR